MKIVLDMNVFVSGIFLQVRRIVFSKHGATAGCKIIVSGVKHLGKAKGEG
jgi:hypothetical protein